MSDGPTKAPRWIVDAIEAACIAIGRMVDAEPETLARELIERLPLERLSRAIITAPTVDHAVAAVVRELTADEEVVLLTSLYLDASRALDVAGVPYATEHTEMLDLGARIRWLAKQHPTSIELECRVSSARAKGDEAQRQLAAERTRAQGMARAVQDAERLRDEANERCGQAVAALEAAEADMRAACGELMVNLDEMPPGSTLRRAVSANAVLRSRLAAATAQIAELESMVDRVTDERSEREP